MTKIGIGIQLYSVRDACEKDFRGTLSALATMGFQGVEFAWNYGGMTPDALAAFLKTLNLACCGLHTSLEDILNPASDSYAYALAVGSPFVTTSLAGEVAKDWAGTVRKVADAGNVAKRKGLTFTYHNHAQEFEKIAGEYALDVLYRTTDAATVQAELDTFWIKKGGEDPVTYIHRYAGRVPQIHLKDMDPDDGKFTNLGAGCVDLPGVIALARKIGTRWLIYEQDACREPSLDAARHSVAYLQNNAT